MAENVQVRLFPLDKRGFPLWRKKLHQRTGELNPKEEDVKRARSKTMFSKRERASEEDAKRATEELEKATAELELDLRR